MEKKQEWCENVMIVDADHVDRVAFDLIVNFERIIGRRIPQADMARWLDCVALDGGLRPGENKVQVVFIHDGATSRLENFLPSGLGEDLDGKAFHDGLGEFSLCAVPVGELTTKEGLFMDVLGHACARAEVRRVMVVHDEGNYHDAVRMALRGVDPGKAVTVFAMEPVEGGGFRQEILGYSLMSALGIGADEIK